jgi:hypothetical protein
MDPFKQNNSDEMHVTLISNAINSHPENTLYNFRNVLAVPMNLPINDTWLVGLLSIGISNKLTYSEDKIRKNVKEVFDDKTKQKMENEPNEFLEHSFSEERLELIKHFVTSSKALTNKRRKELGEIREKIKKLRNQPSTYYDEYSHPKINEQMDQLLIAQSEYKDALRGKQIFKAIYVGFGLKKINARESPVFIELEQVSDKQCGGKAIGFLTLKKNFVQHTPPVKTYFPLENNYLSCLELRVKDVDGNILAGIPSHPTIANLSLKKKKRGKSSNNMYEYHTCCVYSTAEESPSDFHVSLPNFLSEMGINNEWEMALIKSSTPHRFVDVPPELYLEIVERHHSDLERTIYDMTVEEIQDLTKKSKANENYLQVTKKINMKHNLNKADWIELLIDLFGDMEEDQHALANNNLHHYYISEKKGRIEITSAKQLIITMPNYLALALGLQEQVVLLDANFCCLELQDTKKGEEMIKPGKISPSQQKDPAFKTKYENRFIFKGENDIDLNIIKPQTLLVYANCITPSLVGNSYGQYLTNIALDRSESFYSEYSSIHPEYHKLNTNKVNRVRFKLYLIDGREPQYEHADLPRAIEKYRTHLMLSLRRKIKNK